MRGSGCLELQLVDLSLQCGSQFTVWFSFQLERDLVAIPFPHIRPHRSSIDRPSTRFSFQGRNDRFDLNGYSYPAIHSSSPSSPATCHSSTKHSCLLLTSTCKRHHGHVKSLLPGQRHWQRAERAPLGPHHIQSRHSHPRRGDQRRYSGRAQGHRPAGKRRELAALAMASAQLVHHRTRSHPLPAGQRAEAGHVRPRLGPRLCPQVARRVAEVLHLDAGEGCVQGRGHRRPG
ncbi:unnamed protein product [Chondrus crispus]|uniref:Uncharacterized protein n=1 Tax=Chondrus crispus TaxID=2769 RepID=R7QMK9_CHOCR|nr:unnamed protein product [Chondrus crispus]CDF39752.1 unnamed protein product [Chondrus crispus]|eukprot:XP_005710046.1 unnamed protein product [Chondrus crispus]